MSYTAADDEILNGIVEMLWADAWASHVEECGCHNISGCEITEVMPVPPQEAVDMGYALASLVVEKHGKTLSSMFADACYIDGLNASDRKLQSRFGNCIAFEAMGSGVSWEDDYSRPALSKYVHFENCDLMMHADETCEECRLVVHVGSRDEYTDEEGNVHSEPGPGRMGTIVLDVYAKDYRQAKAWADRHQSIDGSSWETARDLDGLVYTITYDRPGLIADLRAEGYTLDLSDYDGECEVES